MYEVWKDSAENRVKTHRKLAEAPHEAYFSQGGTPIRGDHEEVRGSKVTCLMRRRWLRNIPGQCSAERNNQGARTYAPHESDSPQEGILTIGYHEDVK